MGEDRWRSVALKDIATADKYAVVGGPFGSKLVSRDYVADGVPVLRGANLPSDREILLDDLVFVTDEKVEKDLFGNLAHPGDIIVTQRGTLGQIGLLPDAAESPYGRYVVSQSQMKLSVDPTKADNRFVYYALRSPGSVKRIQDLGMSAGVPHINLDIFRNFEIRLPDLDTQRTIARWLHRYDELIENNRRRIEILEDMARLIYREWFAHFRFPGHEDVEFVDSDLGLIPRGWEVARLRDVASLADGDWIETKDQGGSDFRLLQVSNIGVGSFRETGNYRYVTAETFRRLNCTAIEEGDVLVSRMPDPVGRAWYVDSLPAPAITAVDVAIVRPHEKFDGRLLELFLNSPGTLAFSEQVATGTTRKRVTRTVLSGYRLVLPPRDVRGRFDELIRPSTELKANLGQQNICLRRSRDLLLPRLISGELDLGQLDLDLESAV